MKILALRGRNLASLAGDFEVDFQKPPLEGAGVFAITGPTGAGKTSLLDAMCLALFDRTPRLYSRSAGVKVGRADQADDDRLASNDVRTLLHRGAGAGFAEVDFAGRDGRRYRARWSVRRARNRIDGRLQPQSIGLSDLDTEEALGGTKSETLATIEDKLGLSFDQFTRSALLAQGEFSAFLRANARDRAELLERMTGTQIYGELSMAAFERSKREQLELQAVEARLGQLDALDAEARAQLEEALGRRATQVERLRDVVEAAADIARLAERRGRLCSQVGAAERGAAESAAALQGATRAAETAKSALATAETARARAGAELDRAAALDASLLEAQRAVAGASGDLERARRDVGSAETRAAEIERRIEAVQRRAATAAAWLAARPHLTPLAEQWERWRTELERLRDAGRRVEAAAVRREGLVGAQETAAEGERAARLALEQVRRAFDEARARIAEAQSAAAKCPADAVARELEGLAERREALTELASAAARADELDAAVDRQRADGARAVREAEAATADAARHETERSTVAAGFAEAERALSATVAALGLEDRRADLVDGEPCPLCGAEDHPWAAEAPALSGLVAEQRKRVTELRAQLSDVEGGIARSRARADERARRAREAEADVAELAKRRTDIDRWWADVRPRLAEPDRSGVPDVPGGDAATLVAELIAGVERLRTAALERQRESQRCARALAEARDRADQTNAGVTAARDELQRAERANAAAAEAVRECEREAALAQAAASTAEASLAPVADALTTEIDDWAARARLEDAVVSDLAAGVQEFQQRRATVDSSEREVRDAHAALDKERAVADERRAAVDRAVAVLGQRSAARDQLKSERRGLFEGEPTTAVRARLDGAITDARAAFEGASQVETDGRASHADAAARLDRARADLAEIDAEQTAALTRYQAALAAADARSVAVSDSVSDSDSDVVSDSDSGSDLVSDSDSDSDSDLVSDSGSDLVSDSASVWARRVETARGRLEAADQERRELELRRRMDDEVRIEVDRLIEARDAQRGVADLWATMAELIGSSDGKKFRVFAQSLTLDTLLGHANEHLEDLAPRYRLQRVPGYDLDLQVVDQNMGDEVRSVTSLSGGESFLVSLALALGLSSLSARNTRVESLLIDEGFGTLDPATLEVALSSLDALQATGRTVGLISHVPGLAERIGVQVQVIQRGGGRSKVAIVAN